jgi:hypothetical protein
MDYVYWLILIVVLVVGWRLGWIRPTGLAGRNRDEKEADHGRDAAQRWIKKHGDDTRE